MAAVDLAGLRVEGFSLGGIETCVLIPEYKLAFDIGRCPERAIGMPTVLISHAHVDHLAGIVTHCATRALRHMPPPTYVVPADRLGDLEELFAIWRRLDGSDLPCRFVPVEPGGERDLRRDLRLSVFRSPHRAPALGYVVHSQRTKLRPPFRGLSGEEIARRRASGDDLVETVSTPELAYTGDCTIEAVLENVVVRHARRLIVEVTFLDDRVAREDAREMGHVHLDEVVEHAAAFENEALLFVHFSARYRPEEVREIVARRLPAGLRERVQVLVGGETP